MTSPAVDRETGSSHETGPRGHGLLVRRSLSMGVMRFAVVTGATSLASAMLMSSGSAVGDELTAFLLAAAVAGLWSAFDGWRQPLAGPAIAWALASALLVVVAPLPRALSYPPGEGGWTGLGDYLATVWDGAGFVFALTAVPAAVGLAVGRLIRRSPSRPAA